MFGTYVLKWYFILKKPLAWTPETYYQNINQPFQALNDTPVSPERNAAEISLENKVLAERLTGLHAGSESKVWSEWNIS